MKKDVSGCFETLVPIILELFYPGNGGRGFCLNFGYSAVKDTELRDGFG
jgi:hypothetical protein